MQLIALIIGALFALTGIPQETFSYHVDVNDNLTVSDIKSAAFQKTTDVNLGTENGVYWFKIDQIDDSRSILELRTPHVDDVHLFDSNGEELIALNDTRYPTFFLVKNKLTYPIYLKANFELEAYFPIYISNEGEFAKDEKFSLLGLGFFYGTALAILLATIVFFIITGNRQFLFYGVLIIAVSISVMARDNVLYLFNAKPSFISSLELFGHYLVGLSATGFIFLYARIRRYKNATRSLFASLSIISTVLLVIHLLSKSHWSFVATDISSVLTTISLWGVVLAMTKRLERGILLTVVYIINILVLIDAFILQGLGLSTMNISVLEISIIAMLDFTLIATSLLFSFRSMQSKTVIMKHQIKSHLEHIRTLDNYRNVQDADDEYLESLIAQFELENIEVKVLDSISKGLTNERIAAKYNLSTEKLQKVTTALYDKLGLDSDQDLNRLFA